LRESQLRDIFGKTNGHCHFCGDALTFDNRGKAKAGTEGHWELDHVIQRAKGGKASRENCLAACTRCNRLRWHRSGRQLRGLLELGLAAAEQIRKGTDVGKQMKLLQKQRLKENIARRKP